MIKGIKIAAVLGTAALALAACGSSSSSTAAPATSAAPQSSAPAPESSAPAPESSAPAPESSAPVASGLKVGLAYDIGGRGDGSFNDAAAAGLEKAKSELGVVAEELEAGTNETDANKEERLRQLAEDGNKAIIAVGFAYAKAVGKVAKEFPDVAFAIVDDASPDSTAANIANLVFAENEGSFLVGAAAALTSKTGNVGFVGGVKIPLIQKFEAGYTAGAKAVKADIKVQVAYLTLPPDFGGFGDPAKGETAAKGQYDGGADVVFSAAGGSGTGVFKAAKAAGKLAIGVDSDQYNTAPADLKGVILTSMLKRVDVAAFDFFKSVVDGKPLTGVQTFDLKKDGVGYATSGGKVDSIVAQLDKFKADIASGAIKVPDKP